MNDLSLSLHGKNIKILNCSEKLTAFKDKLPLWCRQAKRGHYSKFSLLEEIVDDNESSNLIPSVLMKFWFIWKYLCPRRRHLIF